MLVFIAGMITVLLLKMLISKERPRNAAKGGASQTPAGRNTGALNNRELNSFENEKLC